MKNRIILIAILVTTVILTATCIQLYEYHDARNSAKQESREEFISVHTNELLSALQDYNIPSETMMVILDEHTKNLNTAYDMYVAGSGILAEGNAQQINAFNNAFPDTPITAGVGELADVKVEAPVDNNTYVNTQAMVPVENKNSTCSLMEAGSGINNTEGNPLVNNDQSNFTQKNDDDTGYIYIGDSRFVGMNTACAVDKKPNTWVIAKVAEGYDYLNYGIQQAENIKKSNPNIHNWEYIIGLGVNDLDNIDKYKSTMQTLANTNDVRFVSVNPVKNHKYIDNSQIENFNKNIKNIPNVKYIDTYTCLATNGYGTKDGVHYDCSTYKTISNIIDKYI